MIKIVVAESMIPDQKEMVKVEKVRKTAREKVIADRVAAITERVIKKVMYGLEHFSNGSGDIMKSDSGDILDETCMTYAELIELAESLAEVFQSKGYKASVESFSSGYKVLRRVNVSLR